MKKMEIAALIVGIAGVIAACFFGYTGQLRRTERRELSFGSVENSAVAWAEDDYSDDTQIIYKGTPVKRLTRVKIAFMNTGNVDILDEDFKLPVSIKLTNAKQIFSVEKFRSFPRSMDLSYEIKDDSIIVAPMLMNSGDYFVLSALVSDEGKIFPEAQSRVVGISRFHSLRKGEHPGYGIGTLVVWSLFTVLSIAISVASFRDKGWNSSSILFSILTLACFFIIATIFSEIRKIKRMRWMGISLDEEA